MSSVDQSGTFALGDLHVRRLGFGAMELSGPNVFGPRRIVPWRWRFCAKPSHPA